MSERALARELVERLPLICVKPEVVNGALTSREAIARALLEMKETTDDAG